MLRTHFQSENTNIDSQYRNISFNTSNYSVKSSFSLGIRLVICILERMMVLLIVFPHLTASKTHQTEGSQLPLGALMTKSISVLAVDVGYGNVKSVYRLPDGQLISNIFPALAPTYVKSTISSHMGGPGRNTVVIRVDGTLYEVGPGVRQAVTLMNAGFDLTDDYSKSPNHAALLLGAISLSGADHIECLSLGLPVHIINQSFESRNTQEPISVVKVLKEKFTGVHEINGKQVTVDRVAVIPQPLGSLFWHQSLTRGVSRAADYVSLIIDVGYYSTDWVVAAGWSTLDDRCDGRRGGASEIYNKIAKALSASEGETYTDIRRIDDALRNKTPLTFYSKPIDLTKFVGETDGLVAEVIKNIKNSVQTTNDVAEIILTGGGAAFYKDAIARSFKNKLVLLEDSCFTNVKGFLISGDAALLRAKKERA
jgi:plasmid segregation protein ParM